MEKSFKSSAANYGLILGLILALITVFAYVFMLELYTKLWFGVLLLAVIVITGTLAAIKARKLLGGYISFKNAFTAYFIAILIGTLISTFANIVIFNFVDPGAAETLKEMTMETTRQSMENWNVPQEQIEKSMEEMAKTNSYAIGTQLQSTAFILVFECLIGLIVALVVRKKDPNAVA
ncbi:MAG TPA: DUF4199 domain-containing protein [Flavobacteriaceae bacterium]|nr:DUF4199 domain-containing protein [Flavobacteriaceae bacterium]